MSQKEVAAAAVAPIPSTPQASSTGSGSSSTPPTPPKAEPKAKLKIEPPKTITSVVTPIPIPIPPTTKPISIDEKKPKIATKSPSPNAHLPMDSTRYTKWGAHGPTTSSLTSLSARNMPTQKTSLVMGKGKNKNVQPVYMPTMDEISDELYMRQYRHAMSDSCSSASYTGDSSMGGNSNYMRMKKNVGDKKKQFGPYATKESIKRSAFYGACCTGLLLLSIFVLALAVGLPLIFIKLKDFEN